MIDYLTAGKLLKNYFGALKDLKDAGITSNKKDFTSQIGEWFVSELYGGVKATNSIQKDWDIMLGEKKIQVKTHAKSITNFNRKTPIKFNNEAKIDELIIIIFTEDYNLKEFYKVPWLDALPLIKRNKGADIIHWDHLHKFKIYGTNLKYLTENC
ncbi:hypothetical protein EON78_04910 [bacterium]|nr:MAG: hypothetical protein EON78_04910 [bacterium]